MNNLSEQQKGSLLAFVAVMFITPDSLFIRLSNVDTWGLVFYRGLIPFFNSAKRSLFPKNILLEHSSNKLWKKDLIKFLFKKGYKVVFKNKSNLALTLN